MIAGVPSGWTHHGRLEALVWLTDVAGLSRPAGVEAHALVGARAAARGTGRKRSERTVVMTRKSREADATGASTAGSS
jgi:hypothetical protein